MRSFRFCAVIFLLGIILYPLPAPENKDSGSIIICGIVFPHASIDVSECQQDSTSQVPVKNANHSGSTCIMVCIHANIHNAITVWTNSFDAVQVIRTQPIQQNTLLPDAEGRELREWMVVGVPNQEKHMLGIQKVIHKDATDIFGLGDGQKRNILIYVTVD